MALVDHALTTDTVRARLAGNRRDVAGPVFRAILLLGLALALLVLAVLLGQVVSDGWSVLSTRLWDFLNGTLRTRASEAGVFQGLRGSLWIGIFTVVLAFPIGIGAAIYLEEYAPRTWVTRFISINIRNLAGVPSVVYGLLGLAIFVKALDNGKNGGQTVMAAGLTLAILVLPIVIITSSEAIRAVPDSLREAGYGVGATQWEVIRTQVLPYAAPGIITGTILSLARALGEAAPLILVGAMTGRLADRGSFFDLGQLDERFTAMPMVISTWVQKPASQGFASLAAAAIVVLLAVVLLANTAAIILRNRFEKRK
jgi:phosphate transport system permease protein